MSWEALVYGAIVGAGTAAATGGDPKKGAIYGATGGAIGGAIAPSVVGGTVAATGGEVVGGVIGGGAAGISTMMKSMKLAGSLTSPRPSTKLGPSPTTVMAAERAEADRQGLQKKKRRLSVMGGDYGSLNIQTEKLGTSGNRMY